MSIDRSAPALSLCINKKGPSNLIPTTTDALHTWLIDLSGNIALSGAGIAFLDAQITDLENKCSAERSRIGQERAGKKVRNARQNKKPQPIPRTCE